jgi:hypothetical protein
MNLESFFETSTPQDLGQFLTQSKQELKAKVQSKIRQRRSQMLVHSYIYYVLDDNIVSDDKWQQWANELRDIQKEYPEYCKINFFDREFSTWNGDSGAFLPLKDPYVIRKANYIYNLVKNEENK